MSFRLYGKEDFVHDKFEGGVLVDVLRVEHDRGFLEINIEAFFPCTQKKAKILFPLIRKWCSKETQSALMQELVELADGYEALCKMYANAATNHPPCSKECRNFTSEFKKTNTLYRRMQRNITMLKEVTP